MQQNEPIFAPGLKIDGFKLVRHLGSGGTAEVWEVEDANLNKWALKIFSPTRGMDEQAIRLFKLEFLKTEKLVHPNILRARKYGEYLNRPYIIFDLCDTSIMQMLNDKIHASRILNLKGRGIYQEDELAQIILQVANALLYLHDHGMVHQDIKPDNILVKTGILNDHTYMISDFGVSTDIKMTILRDSEVLGDSNKGLTPDYASPELYQGVVVTPTDIFALGISVYELCTGRPPFSGTSMNTAIALLNNYGSIPDLPEEYSQRFSNIIKKCLELHPEDRPTSAELVQWSSFYLEEGYWPDLNNGRKEVNEEEYNKLSFFDKIALNSKYIVGVVGLFILIALVNYVAIPYFFNPEKKLNAALEAYDFQTAAEIYSKITPDSKAKFPDLNYLSTVLVERVEKGVDFSFLVVKSQSNRKMGLIDQKGSMLIPLEYDHIFKIYNPALVTVKNNEICSHYDLTVSPTIKIDNGICKIFKTRQEFLSQFYKKSK